MFLLARTCPRSRRSSRASRGRAPVCRSLHRKQIRTPRKRNDTGDHEPSRSDAAAGSEDHRAAVAYRWRRLRSGRHHRRLHPARRILSSVPARFHVLVGCRPRFHGDSHDSPPDRWRLGRGNSPHPGRRHAHASAARAAFHPNHSRDAPTLHLGAAVGQHCRQASSRAFAAHHQDLPHHERIHHPRRILFRPLEHAVIFALHFVHTKWSMQTDRPGAPDNTQRFKAISGPGLILYGFTISFAAIDWVMSLDPSWVSTIFGLIILIGEVLSAMCFAVVVERILFNYKPLSEILKPDFVHDHGKWMLAFTMVWAYFNFSQWLIIWAGNLPAEITFYLRRINGGWGLIGLTLALFGFAGPFAMLLSRPFKRDIRKLVWLAVWMLVIRYLDLFWIIEPNFSKTLNVTIADIVVPVAIGAIWLWYFFRNLAALPLLPAYDPDAHEVLQPQHHIHSQGTP